LDALIESNEIAQESIAGAFSGQMLIAMVTVLSFLALLYASEKLVERATRKSSGKSSPSSESNPPPSDSTTTIQQQLARPFAIALMIAIGIGLHNLGEGLAIGAACFAWRSSSEHFSDSRIYFT
jgi:ZIP Zinc transporter.